MNLKTSLILALVFIGLGSVAIFDPFKMKAKREEAKEREGTIFWLKDKKLTWIEIKRGPLDPIRLSCQNADGCPIDSSGEWKLEQPIAELADNNNVGSFLNSLDTVAAVDRLKFSKEAPNLNEFGLQTPGIQLRFQEKGQSESWLKLGTKSSVGSNYYAQTSQSGQDVLLVASYFFDALNKELFHWRNKRIFPALHTESISALSWNEFNFTQKDGRWTLSKPIAAKASSQILNGLAGSLAFLSAQTFVDEKNLPTGAPALSIKVEMDKKSETLDFFETKEKDKTKLLVKSSSQPWVADVEATLLTRFQRKLPDLRDKELLDQPSRAQIASIDLVFPRQKHHAVFKHGDHGEWVQSGGDPVKLSQQRLSGFMQMLGSNRVAAFEKQDLPKTHDLELKLLDKDGKPIAEFSFSVVNKTRVYTKGELPGEVRILTGEFLHALPIRLVDLDVDNNKQVVTSPVDTHGAEGDEDGHSPSVE